MGTAVRGAVAEVATGEGAVVAASVGLAGKTPTVGAAGAAGVTEVGASEVGVLAGGELQATKTAINATRLLRAVWIHRVPQDWR